ncbi:hypothetical protein ACUXST_000009 [Sphingomonas sp. F9_3S_D5_B_2]|jgi:hypothetical protein
MRMVAIIGVIGFATLPSALSAQSNPGSSSGPLGGWQSPSSNPGSGSGDMPGSSLGIPTTRPAEGQVKGAYGVDLSQRLTNAQKLVDEVARGRVLTDRDTRSIRGLMREDFIAWNKRYDLLPSTYRTERDRWLVDAGALSPNAWAEQRLKWLKAQRDWILAHGG